ncbi:hypothetical protein PENSUB_4818 [Penicillium subrubescens]|uniref:Uncharacterized protein n=1 Tax=Penicillium subrubescens TaxID=1316194 RepID=A0A1Q5UBF6_9EURO|nr:hypothetical protein PENSUB_4818 [Penicillium subrubescens]
MKLAIFPESIATEIVYGAHSDKRAAFLVNHKFVDSFATGFFWSVYKGLVDPQAKQHAVQPKAARSLQYKRFWATWAGVTAVSAWL